RHSPDKVLHEVLTDIEVRRTASRSLVEKEQARNGVSEWISSKTGGAIVNGFAIGERALGLKAMAHSLNYLGLQAIVIRVPRPKQSSNLSDIGVQLGPAIPDQSLRSHGR